MNLNLKRVAETSQLNPIKLLTRCLDYGMLFLIVLMMSTALVYASDGINSPDISYSKANILKVKKEIQEGNFRFMPAVKKIHHIADSLLQEGPWSVIQKERIPPSGDKHDYLSFAPYWWPDPADPAAPYIHKDGVKNYDLTTPDKANRYMVTDAAEILSLAYLLFDDERYADHAVEIIKTWFLDDSTAMNPNFEFAQGIPNRTTGRSFGMIESRRFIQVLDAANLLSDSPAYTPEIHAGLQKWFGEFLHWMLTSAKGKKEGSCGNNHESSYTLQVIAYATFTGQDDIVRDQIEHHFKTRLIRMITPEGKQPEELARTRSLHYSIFNLSFLMRICYLASNQGIDLYDYDTKDGRSIRKAVDFLLPYLNGEKDWPYQEIGNGLIGSDHLFYILRRAGMWYDDAKYENTLRNYYGNRYPGRIEQITIPLLKTSE